MGGGRGGFGGDPQANVEALKKAGINAVFYVSQNTAHEWQSWRRSLHEFAPLLFKDVVSNSPAPAAAAQPARRRVISPRGAPAEGRSRRIRRPRHTVP